MYADSDPRHCTRNECTARPRGGTSGAAAFPATVPDSYVFSYGFFNPARYADDSFVHFKTFVVTLRHNAILGIESYLPYQSRYLRQLTTERTERTGQRCRYVLSRLVMREGGGRKVRDSFGPRSSCSSKRARAVRCVRCSRCTWLAIS